MTKCDHFACDAEAVSHNDLCARHELEYFCAPKTLPQEVRELAPDEKQRLSRTLPVGTTVNNGRPLTNRKERRRVAAAIRRGGAKL